MASSQLVKMATSIPACWPARVSNLVDSVLAAPARLNDVACSPLHLALWNAAHAVKIAASAIRIVAINSTRSDTPKTSFSSLISDMKKAT